MIVGFDPDGEARDHRCGAGGVSRERPPEPAGDAGDAHRRSAGRSTPTTPASPAPPTRGGRCGCRASPRSYLIGERTVLKGGYGLYYDTLNAVRLRRGAGRLQRDDDVDDFRRSGAHVQVGHAGDRCARTSIRSRSAPTARGGTRWSATRSASIRCSAGRSRRRTACASTRASSGGGCPSSANSRRDSASKWRTPAPTTTSCPMSIREDYLPEQYWDGSNTRNTAANTYPHRARAESVLHQQLRVAEHDGPGAVSAPGVQSDVLVGDDSAQPPAASVWRS